jgi:predicted DNA-binding transcriptional regulator YafY
VVGIEEASVRALTKVVHVMPSRLRRQIDALAAVTDPAPWAHAATSVDADVLVSLAQACRDGERLAFTYTARGGEQTTRAVDPHRLVLLGRRWYLVAWDLSRFDWRTFRLDRVTAPGTTGDHAMPRELPGGDAAEFVKSSIDSLPSRHQVEALVHAPAPMVRQRVGRWATVEDKGDDRCHLSMSADTLDWPSMVLGNTGAEFEVLAPLLLVDHLRDWAERFGRAVGGDGPSPARARKVRRHGTTP